MSKDKPKDLTTTQIKLSLTRLKTRAGQEKNVHQAKALRHQVAIIKTMLKNQ